MIVLPKKIYLTATGKHWRVSYTHAPGKLTLLEFSYRKLVISGTRYSKRAAIQLLNKWVKVKAKDHLESLLIKHNAKIKAKYKKIYIHSLKTEWGSCSSKKVVGLNYKIIFLPPRLVKYIVVHELCHLRHLNHSPAFWRTVAKYDKSWKRNKIAVDEAEMHIPDWLIF